jgi:hypothetical protein
MLALNPQIKTYLHTDPIDMRKSFDGLFGIIKSDLHLDVRDGGVFMFLNLRRNRIKLMYWDRDGIAIWMKRLETSSGTSNRSNSARILQRHSWEASSFDAFAVVEKTNSPSAAIRLPIVFAFDSQKDDHGKKAGGHGDHDMY